MAESNKLKPSSDDDRNRLSFGDKSLFNQISQLSDNNRRLRRKIFDQYTVFEISRHLSSMLDTKSLLDAILLTCIGQMGVEGALILLTDSQSKFIAGPQAKGIDIDGFHDVVIDYNNGLVGTLLKSGRPLMSFELFDYLTEDEKFFRMLKKLDIRLAVPMIMKNQLLGILLLPTKLSGASYYENDLEFLSLLMNQLSVALENAQLYERERQINEELYRTQKLLVSTERMAALGKLSASIAHEVNNPLGIISNYLQILSAGKLPEDVYKNYIKILKEEVQRIAGIVRQLLDFYRPHQEQIIDVDIKKVIAESLALVSHQLTNAQIDVQTKIKENLPKIPGSAEKLKQVFLNLLMNARDVMPDGGRLEISARRKRTSVEIEISDSGGGIPEENISKIFEPFFTTKVKDGTGLGLAVCYGIIQWHKGMISVYNNKNGGATFVIGLPLERQDEK